MAAVAPLAGHSPPRDDLDDLLDYDVDDDVFRPLSPVRPTAPETSKKDNNLGIDEALEVSRKARPPRVKLDENRLLSANGIVKLRRRAKDHLKFKGKGHEFSDAKRLLSFYQLWLDDLFPKARFLDALAMVEKAGHKQMLRKERMSWINENRPKHVEDDEDTAAEPRHDTVTIEPRDGAGRPQTPTNDVSMLDDIYSATPLASRSRPTEGSLFVPESNTRPNQADEVPFDDDLDALLAEEPPTAPQVPQSQTDGPDDDELEAMAELDGLW